MDLLTSALNGLIAQQTVQATRRTARGGLIAAALLPVGIGVLLIAIGFMGYAGYCALIPGFSPSVAAILVATALCLVVTCIGLSIWLVMERATKPSPPEIDLSPLTAVIGQVSSEVQKNPGSSVLLSALAGAFVYVAFLDRR